MGLFSFLSCLFLGGAFIFLYKFLFRFCFRLFYCPPPQILGQNKRTNEQLTLKESLQLMLDLGVKCQQHKQRPNKEKSRKMLAHHHQAGPSLREIQLVSRTDRNKDTGGEGISLPLSHLPLDCNTSSAGLQLPLPTGK